VRIAIATFGTRRADALAKVAQGLSAGLENQGHQVDIFDVKKDREKKLSMYGYVIVGISGDAIYSRKIPSQVLSYLKNAGNLVGKRSFGFVLRQPFFAQKLLSRLMTAMEAEGMFLKYSEVLSTKEEAEIIAQRLSIEKG